MRLHTSYPTIATSAFVSDVFDLQNGIAATLWSPTVTSGQFFIQGSHDTTSANFVRMANPAGSGAWIWSVGPGSGCIALDNVFGGLRYGRIESSVAQAATRSLALIVRL